MNDVFSLEKGQKYKLNQLIHRLDLFGYRRNESINHPGEFRISGGNLQIWPVNLDLIISAEFFGDDLESLKNDQGKLDLVNIESNIIILEDGSKIMPDDYIVHIDHGIGIYRRLGYKRVSNKEIEYLFLEFYNGDFLYLPYGLKEKVAKYIGVGRKPKLNKLGTQTWVKTKKKAFENAIRLAKELLRIYAERELAKRKPYQIDRQWDDLIVKSFGFSETDDQLKAIGEVYGDLSSEYPMDRLISGDVGYGKTEVALRAMGQAVANHHQAVIICPTTILAQQHFANITSRMSELPVTVGLLSRFVDSEKQKETIEEIKSGNVDIIVGTHRLFSKDIEFKNLDMLVIDEEQRFGVKQKEYFTKARTNINVLSLSATPIPRTLFMSLSGIRDISQIMTAPQGRKSIETEVSIMSDEKIKDYIDREMSRGGQCYFLHNRIETIQAVASKLNKLIPEAKIAIAHGQMGEHNLSQIMQDFVAKKHDVLLCTTIIENGLDLPNVNTLIVEDADKYGLSQLYQIRGRIGRSRRQAFALLLHKDKELASNAFKRLRALVENSELGSGFNIALNDLEIRGGGNILGREQHGNMEAVGLVLYSQLLSRAVKQLQGK